jgi:hypothetical protein
MEFIKEFSAVLSLNECKLLIDYFENNNSIPIEVRNGDVTIKKNRELNISIQENGKELDKMLFDNIQNALNKYTREINQIQGELKDSGYIIQRYNNDGLEKTEKHIDTTDGKLTLIIFLNNVQVGGELQFNGRKIIPEPGKAVIFPANWMLPYSDTSPISNPRYNVITFIKF